MKKTYILIFLILQINLLSAQNCVLPPPVPHATNITACSYRLAWQGIPGANHYEIKYKVVGTNVWLDTLNSGSNTTVTISGVMSGVKYINKVTAYCATKKAGGTGSSTVKTLNCSVPVVTELTILPDTSVHIAWAGCPSNNNAVRYRFPGNTWTTITTGANSFANITDLTYGSLYEYEVKSCPNGGSQFWSPLDSFTVLIPDTVTMAHKPNIIILLVDDGSYNSYLPTGGPAFFTSPSINRIANEGANFNNFFVTLSVCNPSRATLLTGLMANHHGLRGNKDSLAISIPTIGSILKDNGYYTSFIGKYPDIYNSKPRAGWNYWMAFEAGTGLHQDANYNINGVSKEIIGYNDYTLTDTAIKIIKSNAHEKPFLIVLAYSGVHEPYLAPPGMNGIYDSAPVTVPPNFFPYTKNYPVELYDGAEYPSADSCINDLRNYYEMLNGIDTSVNRFFSVLDSLNETDSTMLIYTSDNGFLRGEHLLHSKTKAYEPSMKVPLFIRYPQWFTANTEINDPLTLNIDLAPTVLDAAGIPDTYNMDGHSLKDYAKGSLNRDEFYFQSSTAALIRAVRSQSYKYIFYNCTSQTEEFFNLITDPLEDTNHINTASYQALIAEYRIKLDSLKNFWGDTLVPLRKADCYLANPVYDRMMNAEDGNLFSMGIFPNPASDQMQIFWISSATTPDHLLIYSSTGQLMFETYSAASSSGEHDLDIPVSLFSNGLYRVSISSEGKVLNQTFEVLR